MIAELLDDGRTVLINGVRIGVDLIAEALLTDKPRRQIVRYEAEDGSVAWTSMESCREGDLVHFRSVSRLDEMDGDRALEFLGMSDISQEEF